MKHVVMGFGWIARVHLFIFISTIELQNIDNNDYLW